MKPYKKPTLYAVEFKTEHGFALSGRPGHGYGDSNHDHHGPHGHGVSSYEQEDEVEQLNAFWNHE